MDARMQQYAELERLTDRLALAIEVATDVETLWRLRELAVRYEQRAVALVDRASQLHHDLQTGGDR